MGAGKRIAADDWTDQDLLTRDEARERLAEEVDAESAALAALGGSGSGSDTDSERGVDPLVQAEIEARKRRLNALKIALANL
jgi:hypothetical protein